MFLSSVLASPNMLSAAPLSNVCVPLLLAQTGYYDFPQIRKHFNPSNSDYFDCDLFRTPPHSPQTVLYANAWLVFILLFYSWSDEIWMLESFPAMKALSHPPFSLSDVGLSLPIVLSCQSNLENTLFVWFLTYFKSKKATAHTYYKLSNKEELIRCSARITFYRKSTTL